MGIRFSNGFTIGTTGGGPSPSPTPTSGPLTFTNLPNGIGRYSSGASYSSGYNPFGPGSSYVLDGTTGYIEIYGNPDTAFGTGDFTVEWFQWENTNNQHARIFAIGQYPSATMAVSLEGGTFYFMESAGWRAYPSYGSITLQRFIKTVHQSIVSLIITI
jgi:hypothetical protein